MGRVLEIDYGSFRGSPSALSVSVTNSNTLFVKFCLMKLSCPLMGLRLADHRFCRLPNWRGGGWTYHVATDGNRRAPWWDKSDIHFVWQSGWEWVIFQMSSAWFLHSLHPRGVMLSRADYHLNFFCPAPHPLLTLFFASLPLFYLMNPHFWANFVSKARSRYPKR